MSTVQTGDVPELGGMEKKFRDLLASGPLYYVLDEAGNVKPTHNVLEWGAFFEDFSRRRVALTELHLLYVSTVFLGMDHGWDDGPPVLWETMVFGWKYGDEQYRYSSRAAAELGHKMTVERVLSKHGRKSRSHKLKVLWKRYRRQTKG